MSLQLACRSSGDGRPVVALHAFPLTAGMWNATHDRVDAAERPPYRLITPDLRGFGGSPLGFDEPHIDRMAEDVAELCDRLGVARFVVVGASLGGYVAMSLMRRFRTRLDGVVLVDTRAGADSEEVRANRERVADHVLAQGTMTALHDDVEPGLLGATTKRTQPDVVAWLRSVVDTVTPASAAWTQRAMATRPDSFDTLRSCRVPALVIVGEEDSVAPPAEARLMAEALGTRVVEIAGAGHLPPVERPGEFATELARFVADLDGAATTAASV